ncbi:MAG: hypothetical protein ACMG51_01505 [Ginsengibacter sp.]
MPKIDAYEREILDVFEKRKLKLVATKAELARLKAAARSIRHQGSASEYSPFVG